MARFATLTIQPRGAHYEVSQQGEVLLRVPRPLFEAHDAADVFPPFWTPRRTSHQVRRLFWNPDTREFLPVGFEAHPARTVEGSGSTPLRSFLQCLWLPTPPVLFSRPYWNPAHPLDPFDDEAKHHSLTVQLAFADLLRRLRPPPGWTHVVNAGQAYLDLLGCGFPGKDRTTEPLEEVCLPVPPPVDGGAGREALLTIGLGHCRRLSPVLRDGRLVAVHAVRRTDRHEAERILHALGLDPQPGPCRRH